MTRPCSVCGEAIAPKRLAALPNAEHCISCARGRTQLLHEAPVHFPQGSHALLTELTDAPLPYVRGPELAAVERAERMMYAQIEALEEIEQ